MKYIVLAAVFLALGCNTLSVHSQTEAPPPSAEPSPGDRDAAPVLLRLLEDRRLTQKPPIPDLGSVISLTTPEGYRLKFRMLHGIGVPVVQALALSRDRQLRARLLEAARWTSQPATRSAALMSLAQLKEPAHFQYFREALADGSIAVRFAAIEALSLWGGAEALPLLMGVAERSPDPILKVFAAQAALRMGDARGRDKLIQFTRDSSWLVRAMAARYLGELGQAQDADLMFARIGPEGDNKFVLAEVCIAAMKLAAKRGPPPMLPPSPPVPAAARTVSRPVPQGFELEPLLVRAPRVRLGNQPVDVRIDNALIGMLERLADEPPPERLITPEVAQLSSLTTPEGYALRGRYSELVYILIEGLAGTRDFSLVQRLENVARSGRDPRARAAALVSLAYDPQRMDTTIFSQGLRDTSSMVRFGAVEALSVLGNVSVFGLLGDASNSDRDPIVRVYAARALLKVGDTYGRQQLLRYVDDPDYVVRAAAIFYLGEAGQADDYHKIQFKLNGETKDLPAAESCLAMLRLSPQ